MKVVQLWHNEKIDYVVLIFAILMDIGWILKWPLLALPSLTIGVVLQTYLVSAMTWAFSRLAKMLMEFGVLIWLVACGVWMMSEFLWDDDQKPLGILSVFANSDGRLLPDRYTACLAVALGIMLSIWVIFAIGSTFAWWPLIYGNIQRKTLVETTKIEVLTSAWFALWLLMEAIWVYIDILLLQSASVHMWKLLALIFGCGAILGCSLCVYKSEVAGMYIMAWQYSAELCWILGNILWQMGDGAHPHWHYGAAPSTIVFSIGAVAACRCLFSWSEEEKPLLEAEGAQEKPSEASA